MAAAKKKKGIQTTEFWMCLLAVMAGLGMASGLIPDGSIAARIAGILASALSALGYTAGRCVVKSLEK